MHAKHIKKHKTWPENKEKRGEKAKKKRYDIDTDLQTQNILELVKTNKRTRTEQLPAVASWSGVGAPG